MKKIKLDLEKLKIDSFEVSKSNSGNGTVNGNKLTFHLDPTCTIFCGETRYHCEPTEGECITVICID